MSKVPWPDIQAVLFDLDGTLVDSAPELGAAADRMRVERGMASLPLSAYRSMAGAGARGMLGVAFGLRPEDAQFPELREEFFKNYEALMLDGTHAFEGVEALIAQLGARRLPWGVVTNKASRFTVPLTGSMSLFRTAQAIISGDTTPHSKPHPAPLLEAARRMGVDPARCVYVGDDQRDIVAGRAAGMKTVAVAYGYLGAEADVTLWEADAVISLPLDLLQWLPSA